MDIATITALTALTFATAVLYSSVGQAGASGYLAAMALLSVDPAIMRPTALVLNILVASIATVKFYRADCFSWRTFWPFALTAVPFAFIGGGLTLPGPIYKTLVGIVLLYAAYRMFRSTLSKRPATIKPMPIGAALMWGVGIGLLAGLTGVGGGIFLTPLLLFMGWADPRLASGVSAAFILVNSIAGLLGQTSRLVLLPAALPMWAVAAVVGGWIGSEYGSQRLGHVMLRRLLAVVLVIAGLRSIFG